jgi:hypothetical protein
MVNDNETCQIRTCTYQHLNDPVKAVDYAANSPVSVRLLDVLPSAKTDDIECELRCVTLGNDVYHEVLSYTWDRQTAYIGYDAALDP